MNLLTFLVLGALLVVTNLVTYVVTKDKAYKIMRKKIREIRFKDGLSSIPWNAVEVLNNNLYKHTGTKLQYPFQLAALVVEDEDGNLSIQDYDLRGEDSSMVSLMDFSRSSNPYIDEVFTRYDIVKTLFNRLGGDIVEDVERYTAFQITLENCMGGRHGKDKIKVNDAFVIFIPLDYHDLDILANLEDDFSSITIVNEQLRVKERAKLNKRIALENDYNKVERICDDMDRRVDKILDKFEVIEKMLALHNKKPVLELPEICLNAIPKNKIFYAN